MKPIIVRMVAALAALTGLFTSAQASDWLRDGTMLTEQGTETPWVLTVKVTGSEISVTKVSTAGANTELDFSGAIKDAEGADYTIVSLDGFSGKAITKLVLPDSLRDLGSTAFRQCTSLTEVTPLLPPNLVTMGGNAFSGCTKLTGDVVFPSTVSSVTVNNNGERGFFKKTLITSCDMSACSITRITDSSFSGCSKLVWVKLPETVETIESAAFASCPLLTSVTPLLPDSLTSVGGSCFDNDTSLVGEVVHKGARISFARSQNYGTFRNTKITSVNLSSTVTSLPEKFCAGCTELSSVTLPDSVQELGAECFSSCSKLTSFALPAGLKSIGLSAFWKCTALESVTPFLPETLTSIGGTAFFGCTKLAGALTVSSPTSVAFCKNNNQGSSGIFGGTVITSLTVTSPITAFVNGTTYSPYVFSGAKSLESVTLPETFASFGGSEFQNCTGLKTVCFNGGFVSGLNSTTFDSITDYKACVYVPRFDLSWESFREANVVALTTTAQTKFTTAHPGHHLPLGTFPSSTKTTKRNIFYTDKREDEYADTAYVIGRPYHIAAETVDYGTFRNFSAAKTLELPEVATYQGTDYIPQDWQIDVETSDRVWEKVYGGKTRTITLEPDAQHRNLRLTVNWKVSGFAIDLEVFGGDAAGTVAVSPRKDLYLVNEEVTLTATPAAGRRFCCWVGDVPDDLRRSPNIVLTMSDARTIRAVFDCDHWTYDASTGTMTDGNWTIKDVSVNSTAEGTLRIYRVGNADEFVVVSVGLAELLDLNKPIVDVDGGNWRISKITQPAAFANLAGLCHVRLPSQITELGSDAFRNCADLVTVEPMFPPTLERLGQAVFYQCTSLTGDVVFCGNSARLAHHNNNQFGTFQGTRITSLDIRPPLTEALPANVCNGCKCLRRVCLPDNAELWRGSLFLNCSALESVTPFLPRQSSTLGSTMFSNCTSLTNDLFLSGEFTSVGVNGNLRQGVFQGVNFKIVTITAPVAKLGGGMFSSCTNLTTVMLPEALSDLGGGTDFSGDTQLASVYFAGSCPTNISSTTFSKVTDYKVRVFVPRGDASWEAPPTGTMTPWQDLDQTIKDKYFEQYPGEKRPRALWYIKPTVSGYYQQYLWVLTWNPNPPKGLRVILR